MDRMEFTREDLRSFFAWLKVHYKLSDHLDCLDLGVDRDTCYLCYLWPPILSPQGGPYVERGTTRYEGE